MTIRQRVRRWWVRRQRYQQQRRFLRLPVGLQTALIDAAHRQAKYDDVQWELDRLIEKYIVPRIIEQIFGEGTSAWQRMKEAINDDSAVL